MVFSNKQYNFYNKWKNVHPVYATGIWTHNLSNMSRHPLDQGFHPLWKHFYDVNERWFSWATVRSIYLTLTLLFLRALTYLDSVSRSLYNTYLLVETSVIDLTNYGHYNSSVRYQWFQSPLQDNYLKPTQTASTAEFSLLFITFAVLITALAALSVNCIANSKLFVSGYDSVSYTMLL